MAAAKFTNLLTLVSAHPPLQQGIWRISIGMMLENPFHLHSDRNFLHRTAQQVAHHAHAACLRQFDQDGEVGTMVLEGHMGGMPDTLPTENATARLDLGPFWIEGVAAMTQPFR
jgi:hypothetical protein